MPVKMYEEDEVIVSTEDLQWPIYSYELGNALLKVVKYAERKCLEHDDNEGLMEIITILKNEIYRLTGA